MNKHKRNGFTLAELLILIAMIAIVAAIAIPVIGSAFGIDTSTYSPNSGYTWQADADYTR